MTRDEIFLRLQDIFDNIFLEPVTLTNELSASDVEEWDSLIHITLIVAVEKAFGIRFRVGEVESTSNIGEFVDLIQRRFTDK